MTSGGYRLAVGNRENFERVLEIDRHLEVHAPRARSGDDAEGEGGRNGPVRFGETHGAVAVFRDRSEVAHMESSVPGTSPCGDG